MKFLNKKRRAMPQNRNQHKDFLQRNKEPEHKTKSNSCFVTLVMVTKINPVLNLIIMLRARNLLKIKPKDFFFLF